LSRFDEAVRAGVSQLRELPGVPAKRPRRPPAKFYDTESYRWVDGRNIDLAPEINDLQVRIAMSKRERDNNREALDQNEDELGMILEFHEEIEILEMQLGRDGDMNQGDAGV
jgi:hypothetical protein